MATFSPPNWADGLTEDLFGKILERLILLSDYIRFGAVCKSWYATASNHREKRAKLINHQLPWLLTVHEEDKQLRLRNYPISEILDFKLSVPEVYFCGNSHGWLVYSSKSELSVVNPLSGASFSLPPMVDQYAQLGKVVLSRDPSLGDLEVLWSRSAGYGSVIVAYLKYGNGFWTNSKIVGGFFGHTFAFCRGRILGVSNQGRVVSLNVVNGNIEIVEIVAPDLGQIGPDEDGCTHLVETSNGDLISVFVHEDDLATCKIYKLVESNGGQGQHIPAVNLGGDSLFLGFNSPISVIASNYPARCRPNFVYYAFICMDSGNLVYQVVEFSLEDGSVRRGRSVSVGKSFVGAWIVPSMSSRRQMLF